jgi:hypothetical protein
MLASRRSSPNPRGDMGAPSILPPRPWGFRVEGTYSPPCPSLDAHLPVGSVMTGLSASSSHLPIGPRRFPKPPFASELQLG